jgi:prepilin-type N-terminal cleavage/methylation domain-containing protein
MERQDGFTLTELMVSIAITVILMTAVLSVFSSSDIGELSSYDDAKALVRAFYITSVQSEGAVLTQSENADGQYVLTLTAPNVSPPFSESVTLRYGEILLNGVAPPTSSTASTSSPFVVADVPAEEYEASGTYSVAIPWWAANARLTLCGGGGGGRLDAGGAGACLSETVPVSQSESSLNILVGDGGGPGDCDCGGGGGGGGLTAACASAPCGQSGATLLGLAPGGGGANQGGTGAGEPGNFSSANANGGNYASGGSGYGGGGQSDGTSSGGGQDGSPYAAGGNGDASYSGCSDSNVPPDSQSDGTGNGGFGGGGGGGIVWGGGGGGGGLPGGYGGAADNNVAGDGGGGGVGSVATSATASAESAGGANNGGAGCPGGTGWGVPGGSGQARVRLLSALQVPASPTGWTWSYRGIQTQLFDGSGH